MVVVVTVHAIKYAHAYLLNEILNLTIAHTKHLINRHNKNFIDKEKLLCHFNHTVEQIPHYEACFCKWHCAGDCAIKTLSEKTIDGYHPTERCYVNQELTKFLILDKMKKSGEMILVNKNKSW